MATIDVMGSKTESGWSFEVTVSEGSTSHHKVTLSQTVFDKLSDGAESPEDFVKKSFDFLLERESKESIMSSFDITVISRYFSEYEREIKKR